MKGLELSEKFYLEYGEPMLKESFPSLLELIAVDSIGFPDSGFVSVPV